MNSEIHNEDYIYFKEAQKQENGEIRLAIVLKNHIDANKKSREIEKIRTRKIPKFIKTKVMCSCFR